MGNSPRALEASDKPREEAWVSAQHGMRSAGTWQRASPWQGPQWARDAQRRVPELGHLRTGSGGCLTPSADWAARLSRHGPVSLTRRLLSQDLFFHQTDIRVSSRGALPRQQNKDANKPLTCSRGHRGGTQRWPPPLHVEALNFKFHFPIAFQ